MSNEPQRPKSNYQVFYDNLDLCQSTGRQDIVTNVNKNPLNPFAPRSFARTLYQHTDEEGVTTYAWVSKIGKKIMIWSAD